MMPYSLEVTPRDKDAFEAVARLLPPLTEVFVADLPDQEPELLIEACARYRRAGFRPVPHLVARNIESVDKLRFLLSRLVGDAEVERALVLGGDRSEPAGPFKEALDLLETGQLSEHGIRKIALACFPEGHPDHPGRQSCSARSRPSWRPRRRAISTSCSSASSCSTPGRSSTTRGACARAASPRRCAPGSRDRPTPRRCCSSPRSWASADRSRSCSRKQPGRTSGRPTRARRG